MKATHSEIGRVLADRGVIARRDHPGLAGALSYLAGRGQLCAVLPGIYAPAEQAGTVTARLAALRHYDADAVVTGAAAASLTFWPQLRVDQIECAAARKHAPQVGFSFARRVIPPELIVERSGWRLTTPALTALDLAPRLGGEAIDEVLRSRMTTLAHLHQALELTAGRDDNHLRRRLLLDSRAEPWSGAEREAHRLLRGAGITGWRANRRTTLRGQVCYLDIEFEELRVAVEIDGREHHIGRTVFETDRWRQNLLVLEGWLVLRFTWTMLIERPEEVIALIREALASRGVARPIRKIDHQ